MPSPSIGVDGWRCAVTDPPDTDRVVEIVRSVFGERIISKGTYGQGTGFAVDEGYLAWTWREQLRGRIRHDIKAWRELNAPT